MKNDLQLQADVMEELQWEPSINAAHIGVEVSDGVVTLAGHVGSFAEKWEAERAAQRVMGVKALAIDIDVNLVGISKRSDADIARSAENIIEWTTYVPKDSIQIMVEDGWITLTGEVEWAYQKQYAASSLRSLLGVVGVSDQVGIKARVLAGDVQTDIEAALQRRAHKDAKKIAVNVVGSEITLTGTARNWEERSVAINAAWSTPGVHSVVSNITLV
jgi:osmotically-inducible protein OsmY